MMARPPDRKRRLRCWLPLLCLSFFMPNMLAAQDTGQVCVQSFDDRDGDGTRDADEMSITRGIGASLNDAAGVTIASQLLEDSPFAERGLICFEQLLAGDYQITMTSAEYAGTAATTFAASVNPGAAPALIEYGARPLHGASGAAGSGFSLDAEAAEALAIAVIGSMIVGAAISIIALLILLLIFRRRRSPAPTVRGKAPPSASVAEADPLHKLAPSAGSPPLFADEETDAASRADS